MAFFTQLLASFTQFAMISMVIYVLLQAGYLQSLIEFISPQQGQTGQRVLHNAQTAARSAPGPQLPPAPSKGGGKKKKGKKSDDAGEQQVCALRWHGTVGLWCRTQWL
jgi:hypothetical protein